LNRESEDRQKSYALIDNNHPVENKKKMGISLKIMENSKYSNRNFVLYSPKNILE
jgi:hypothetical protein